MILMSFGPYFSRNYLVVKVLSGRLAQVLLLIGMNLGSL